MSLAARIRVSIAAMTAFVLIAGGFLAVWHRTVVVHGVCAEHGDELHLIQVDDGEATTAPDDGTTRADASDWQAIEGDQHCQLAAASRDAMRGSASDHAGTAAPVALLPLDAALAPVSGVAILRLAPKTSPPRA